MTQRKPPGVSFENWIEGQIRRVQEDGEFDDLPSAPTRRDEPYDPDWWAKSLIRREKLSILPPSLEIKREVEKTLVALAALPSEKTVRDRIRALNTKIAKINSQVTSGPPSTQAPLNEEKVVARWREERSQD